MKLCACQSAQEWGTEPITRYGHVSTNAPLEWISECLGSVCLSSAILTFVSEVPLNITHSSLGSFPNSPKRPSGLALSNSQFGLDPRPARCLSCTLL